MMDLQCGIANIVGKILTSASCGPKTDYVKAYMEACHNREMYAGIYYSPMDWRFPGYFDPKRKCQRAQQ